MRCITLINNILKVYGRGSCMKKIIIILAALMYINVCVCEKVYAAEEFNKPLVILREAVSSKDHASKEKAMGWLIIHSLTAYMQKPLKDYYGVQVPFWVETSSSKVLEAECAGETPHYVIKIQIQPYLGAHNPVGIDNFTFNIDLVNNKTTLEKYEHVKSFKLPEHVKKNHPELVQ